MRYPSAPKTAVVTGCSTGIGLATATMLKARDWQVFATARQPDHLAMLKAQGLHPIMMDMVDETSVAQAAAQILEATDGRLGAVVNNAGFGQPGALEDLSRETLRHQFEVNVLGLHQLTQAFVPAFRSQGAGRIVNVSSVLGRLSTPLMGAYCASKFAVEALSDAQRVELRHTGIAVSIIEPGPIITAFGSRAMSEVGSHIDTTHSPFGNLFRLELERRQNSAKRGHWMNQPPSAVARKIAHALESPRPRRRYCVTPHASLGALLRRFAPYALLDAALDSRVRKMQREANDTYNATA